MKSHKILMENINLHYPLYGSNELHLRKSLTDLATKKPNKEIVTVHALKNINLEINSGERIGLVGHNGSGKTTMLKLIAGIYKQSSGSLTVSHEPYCLIDVAMGMQADATGIENIFLMSYLRGYTKSFVEKQVEWIIDFAGIGDAIYRELRTYSSGMKVRLATAFALSIEPEILIFDEFFGAGDANFLDKTAARLDELLKKSGIFVLSSHNETIIEQNCNRLVVLENGVIIKDEKI